MSSDDRRGGPRPLRRSRSRSPSPRRPGRRRYNEELAAGLDGDLRYDSGSGREGGVPRRRRSRSRSRSPSRPSTFLAIHGLPAAADEAQVQALFAPVPGVVQLRLEPGRGGAEERGEESTRPGRALLEMATPALAQSLMESGWRDGAHLGPHRLRLTYARAPPRGDGADWICPACRGLNFGWRGECYQCHAPRTEAARAVPDPSAPSPCLRIANIEPQTTEQDLEYAIKPHVPLRHIRIARDRASGAPRGFAFATFGSVGDATAALQALNGAHIPGQKWKLRIFYAPDLLGPGPAATAAAAAEANPLQAAAWEPAAFDEAALEGAKETGGPAADPTAQKSEERQGGGGGGSSGGGGAPAPVSTGLEYDAASGYMREPATGFLFDAATGLYFNPGLQQWGSREGGEFRPRRQQRGRQEGGGSVAPRPAPKYVVHTEAEKAAGAVIGAAPQVDPAAVAAAAAERARQREEEEEEEAAAARGGLGTGQQQQQQQAAAAAPQPGQPVQGILHKGSWAARRAQLKQQQQG